MSATLVLHSDPFGPFHPYDPENIPGEHSCKIVAEPVEIKAPVEFVWRVMTDFAKYNEWNPMNRFFNLNGKAKTGDTVTFGPCWGPYDVDPLPEHDQVDTEVLTVWEENACLSYACITDAFSAERSQFVCDSENGHTRYITFERFSGEAGPDIKNAYGEKILKGFTANGLALKARAESLYEASLK